jgi:hypothetical protein
MKKYREKRNWSHYNRKLKKIARIDFFISEEAIEKWEYNGKRKPGGKIIYSDHVIELCLIIREFYKFAYRQTQGFIESVLHYMKIEVATPDYSTMSRRCGKLKVSIRNKLLNCKREGSLVVAVDSTGLSLYSGTEWNRIKHRNEKTSPFTKWRKLHIAIDTGTGEILSSLYGAGSANDGQYLPELLEAIEDPISAVCGDMAYDTVNCRKAIYEKGARQLIPPLRGARLSQNNKNIRKYKKILQERDDAINYINNNTVNADKSLARAAWKKKVGYHMRSLIESTMLQIKQHCRDRITNRNEQNRIVQSQIKCKIVNLI